MILKSYEKKRTFLRRINLYRYYSHMNRILNIPVEGMFLENSAGENVDIITIVFNNVHVLKHQIAKIKQNVTDSNYTHIIVDNSNIPERRDEIRTICKENRLLYIGMPQLENSFIRGSKSHAVALNWVYYQVVLKRNSRWFGFLDHDIYPIHPVSIIDMFKSQSFYGKKEIRDGHWYLWPGFAFFEASFLANLKVDFSPSKVGQTYLDTGGALWYSLYSNLSESDFVFPQDIKVGLDKLGYNYPEEVEFIDHNWFHSMNASSWKKRSDYNDAIDDILKRDDISF